MHNNVPYTQTSLCADVLLNSTNLGFQPVNNTYAPFSTGPFNFHFFARVFPHLTSITCICFEFWLVYCVVCGCLRLAAESYNLTIGFRDLWLKPARSFTVPFVYYYSIRLLLFSYRSFTVPFVLLFSNKECFQLNVALLFDLLSFLCQIIDGVFSPDAPELPDIEFKSHGFKDLIKTGFR